MQRMNRVNLWQKIPDTSTKGNTFVVDRYTDACTAIAEIRALLLLLVATSSNK